MLIIRDFERSGRVKSFNSKLCACTKNLIQTHQRILNLNLNLTLKMLYSETIGNIRSNKKTVFRFSSTFLEFEHLDHVEDLKLT